MRVAIVGATGSIGRPVAETLAGRGHEVRRLSRGSAEHPVDLTAGTGLDRALAGCSVVVDASNGGRNARSVLIEGGRRLLDAETRAGVRHHVCISIVGIERVPLGYYRVKLGQEELVAAASPPSSVVRATQFHTLLNRAFAAGARAGLLPGAGFPLQPADPGEVATAIADVAEGEPRAERMLTVAGPEVATVRDLARSWRRIVGSRAIVAPVPLPGRVGRGLRAGGLTDPDPDHRCATGFASWLERATRS